MGERKELKIMFFINKKATLTIQTLDTQKEEVTMMIISYRFVGFT